jgi:transposase-like protein
MDFPISDLMDEGACYRRLLDWLHPGGLACPRCSARDGLRVLRRAGRAGVQGPLLAQTREGASVYTDTHGAYHGLGDAGRDHHAVDHDPKCPQWSRDDDGDGVREVHCNTCEGIWAGLRNFLRPFRGLPKKYLDQYAAVFEWGYNLKAVAGEFVRALFTDAPAGEAATATTDGT